MTDTEIHGDARQHLILGESKDGIDLHSRQQCQEIVTNMVVQSRRTVRIFSPDIEPAIYDQSQFVEACKKMALTSQFARIQILTMDSRKITQRGHRLVSLARILSSRIEIRRVDKQYESLGQTFITADAKGYLYRKNHARYEGSACFYNPLETRKLDKLFDEIWQQSHVDREMRSLNL